MKFSILISHYKESENVLSKLLSSISLQQGVNFDEIDVVVCSDGNYVILSEAFLKKWPFEIRHIINNHGELAKTRNTLLDNAIGDYVMFCDADDMFYDVLAFYKILKNISNKQYDVAYSRFIAEHNESSIGFYTIDRNVDMVHGKIFRRDYLMNNNIRWKDELGNGSDPFFLAFAMNMSTNILYIEDPFYLWNYNKNSISRTVNDYINSIQNKRLMVYDAIIKESYRRNMDGFAQWYITKMVCETYCIFHKNNWTKDKYDLSKDYFWKLYRNYKDTYELVPIEIKSKIVDTCRLNYSNIISNDISIQSINKWLGGD